MRDSVYFPHHVDMSKDIKIRRLIRRHGYEGYGLFWLIIEELRISVNNQLLIADLEVIAYDAKVDEALLISIVNDFDLFSIDDNPKLFYSIELNESVEIFNKSRDKKSAAGRAGMKSRWANKNQNDNNVISSLLQNDNDDITSKVKESKESKVNEIKENTLSMREGNLLIDFETKATFFIDSFNVLKGNRTNPAKHTLSEEVKSLLAQRLNEGFTWEVFRKVIENIKSDKFHLDNGLKFLEPKYILDPKNIERYANTINTAAQAQKSPYAFGSTPKGAIDHSK